MIEGNWSDRLFRFLVAFGIARYTLAGCFVCGYVLSLHGWLCFRERSLIWHEIVRSLLKIQTQNAGKPVGGHSKGIFRSLVFSPHDVCFLFLGARATC